MHQEDNKCKHEDKCESDKCNDDCLKIGHIHTDKFTIVVGCNDRDRDCEVKPRLNNDCSCDRKYGDKITCIWNDLVLIKKELCELKQCNKDIYCYINESIKKFDNDNWLLWRLNDTTKRICSLETKCKNITCDDKHH